MRGHGAGAGRAMVLALGILVLVRPGPAHAEVQISDLFKKTARRLVQEIAVKEMKDACASGDHAAICQEFVAMLGNFVVDSVSGNLDKEEFAGLFKQFGVRALVAVGADEMTEWLATHLTQAGAAPEVARLGSPFRRVLLCTAREIAVPGGGGAGDDAGACSDLDAAVGELGQLTGRLKEMKACLASDGSRVAQALCVARIAVDYLAAKVPAARELPARFELVAGTLERLVPMLGSGRSIFHTVTSLVLAFDELDETLISSPFSNAVFDRSAPPAASGCARLAAAVQAFPALRDAAYLAYAGAVARGVSPDGVDAKLRLPFDPGCAATDPWYEAVAYAHFQGELSAAIHRFELPALVAAALVDFARHGDAKQLGRDLAQLATFAVARQLGGSPRSVYTCVEASSGFQCTSIGPVAGPALTIGTAVTSDSKRIVGHYIESRFGLLSGERNCLVQALAAVTRMPVPALATAKGTIGLCWMDGSLLSRSAFDELRKALHLETTLEDLPGFTITGADLRILQWDARVVRSAEDMPAMLEQSHRLWVRLALPASVDVAEIADRALEMLLDHLDDEAAEVAGFLRRLLAGVRDGDEQAMQRALEDAAVTLLREPTGRFVDRLLGASKCTASDSSARCVVRAVALAFFEPLTHVIAGDDADQTFVTDVAHRLAKIEPLGDSIFLFELGLAYTGLYIDPGDTTNDDWSEHFTVLDKWGLAWRPSRHFEVGIFAGGFIDAIVRSADGGATDPAARWLVGLTLGVPHLGTLPLGISLYTAWAPPVDWSNQKKAFVLGVSLDVPIDLVIGE